MWLFLAFILVPLIEIALFVQVGGAIGLWSTLAIVLITAIAGAYLVRSQGLATMKKLHASASGHNEPSEYLAHGLMIFFAGALLLTPGFFTDVVGFALLIPFVRHLIYVKIQSKLHVHHEFTTNQSNGPMPRNNASDVIDGEFTEVPPEDDRPKQSTNPR